MRPGCHLRPGGCAKGAFRDASVGLRENRLRREPRRRGLSRRSGTALAAERADSPRGRIGARLSRQGCPRVYGPGLPSGGRRMRLEDLRRPRSVVAAQPPLRPCPRAGGRLSGRCRPKDDGTGLSARSVDGACCDLTLTPWRWRPRGNGEHSGQRKDWCSRCKGSGR